MPTIYYRTAGGSLVQAEASDGVHLEAPEGATPLDRASYEAAQAAAKAARDQERAAAQAAEQAEAKAAHDALAQLGLPASVVQRLTGYRPADHEPDGGH
ncbi:hypothetical protein AQJ11_03280 [Streptomyces corchorusii]|uniref:Uncharacterized protein n=2 Tax=Streptomyces TaxID=1883 RepID=A0A117QJZ9_STRCK|nr:hypothetical protein [Streptomyces corchorusii]KUN32561.1 hypothetical protein AQJ11_03280 [Streptomyces corchorusii]